MHRPHDGQSPSGHSDRYVLRVLRVDSGTQHQVLMLSETYSGLLTHHVRGRSEYCPGEDLCLPATHRIGTQWKGYCAAELWHAATSRWYPTVLEITEGCELSLRGRYKRGQVWRLARAEQERRGRHASVTASYVNTLDGEVPPAFDILPVLATLYHAPGLRLGVANPMPSRVLAAPRQGVEPAPAANADTLDTLSARKLFKELSERFGRNGKQEDGKHA